MRYPTAVQKLIEKFTSLPSVGPKTAERYVFYLLKQPTAKLQDFISALTDLPNKTTLCEQCGVITEISPCPVCQDDNRKNGLLCLVENSQDLLAIEATKQHTGRYFILGGLINTIDDIKPSDLNIEKLLKKIKEENIKELILALNFTLEGETTALYLNKILKNTLRITRLARGLPAGSDLEYADEMTLSSALKYRSELK